MQILYKFLGKRIAAEMNDNQEHQNTKRDNLLISLWGYSLFCLWTSLEGCLRMFLHRSNPYLAPSLPLAVQQFFLHTQCLQLIQIHPYLYGFCVAYTDIRALRTIIRKHTLVSGPQIVSSTFRRLIINTIFSVYASARKVVCGSIDIKYSGVSMVH